MTLPRLTMGKNCDCKHYPCHKDLEDCTFCYCPLYPCEKTDKGKWLEDKIWDCSECTYIHNTDTVEIMCRCIEYYIKQYIEVEKLYSGED
jgi:Zn-finger protein